jgi:hypothetical protein
MTPLVIERPVKWPVNLFLGSGSDSGAAEAKDGHGAGGGRLRARLQS